MKTSKQMQTIIGKIAKKHSVDLNQIGAHLKLTCDGYMPLVIEVIGRHLVSVAHYSTQNGDLIADPDIVFFTGYEEWIPFEITQTTGYQKTTILDEHGQLIAHLNNAAQSDIANFCNTWSLNIRRQGWLERGIPVHAVTKSETGTPNGADIVRLLALSVRQPYASAIARREKMIEYRCWATAHRGPLLVVSSKRPLVHGLPCGQAVAIVQLKECRLGTDGQWEWILKDAMPVEPFSVRGQLRLYPVDVCANLLDQMARGGP